MSKVVSISANCDDRFSAVLVDENGNEVGEYSGYVPNFLIQDGFDSYLDLEIDVETGRILNWVPPTEDQLDETFGKG